MPNPFLVLATQNPIETEGTYALPEAQVDRFMLKVLVGYPNPTEEFVIVERMTSALQAVQKVLTTEQLLEPAKKGGPGVRRPGAHRIRRARCVDCQRSHDPPRQEVGVAKESGGAYTLFCSGASPRASINLILTARALAFVRGRDYALPQDVLDMALDVMRHRLVLSYEALSDNVASDDLLKKILERIPIPVVPLHEHANVRNNA